MSEGLHTLSEKEKETLRLIVRGHDAKSAASELDLSVHTINERLRSARRKLDVTSSREAARMLLESETVTPDNPVYETLGDATETSVPEAPVSPLLDRRALWIGGIAMLSALSFALAMAAVGVPSDDGPGEVAALSVTAQPEAYERAALAWLKFSDADDWQGSYDAASTTFRKGVSLEDWAKAGQLLDALGSVQTRKALEVNVIHSSGADFHVIRFKTDFENRKGAFERVTLEYEDGELRVSGYFIE